MAGTDSGATSVGAKRQARAMFSQMRTAIRPELTVMLMVMLGPAFAEPEDPDRQAQAEPPAVDAAGLGVSHGLRLSLEPVTMSNLPGASQPSVFTSVYWSRSHEEHAALAERFGLHWAYGLSVDPVGNGQYSGRSPLGYPENSHWTAKPMAGLQFERRGLLLAGDRFTVRATSDLQTLMRETGLFRSSEEVDMLSLLGWRSRSAMVWQLGEPTREIQWQFSARLDRRAYSQSNSANFSLLRRF